MSQKRPARQEIVLYMNQAHEMLTVAEHNLNNGFYTSAINRAYYAIFYAAIAMICTQRSSRSKRSGVIGAFRQVFVKAGIIEAEYSHIYGRVMDDRHLGDYEIHVTVTPDEAARDLEDARRFIDRVKVYLCGEGWL